MSAIGIEDIRYTPANSPTAPESYGQVGTELTVEIDFATDLLNPAMLFQWGFIKNSQTSFYPGGYQLQPDLLKNTVTEQIQAYTGNNNGFDFMPPVSAKDGDLQCIDRVAGSYDAWVNNTTYAKGAIITYLAVDYISLNNENKGKIPSNSPLDWAIPNFYTLIHTCLIQPLTRRSDFDANLGYSRNDFLAGIESTRYIYQIDLKSSVASPTILASTQEIDPLFKLGSIGFLQEKLNGLPQDVELSELVINSGTLGLTEGITNDISFKLSAKTGTLLKADSHVQLICQNLDYEENFSVNFLTDVNFSSASDQFPDNLITQMFVTESSGSLIVEAQISGDISGTQIIYVNVISDKTEQSEQSLQIFIGDILEPEQASVYEVETFYGSPLGGDFTFYPQYANVQNNYAFNNVAAYVDDIILTKVNIAKKDQNASLNSINISLIAGDGNTVLSENYSDLPILNPTNLQINSVPRQTISISEGATGTISIDYPIQILNSWIPLENIRFVVDVNYSIDGDTVVERFNSAPMRLETYNTTQNGEYEPQILAVDSDDTIKIQNENGTLNINQFNAGENARIVAIWEDKNPFTDSLQADVSELCGYIAIASPSSPEIYHYIHSIFGALGTTFFKEIDGSGTPICKITKIDTKTAKVEAVTINDSIEDFLASSTQYDVIARLDRIEGGTYSLDQYAFIFNQNKDLLDALQGQIYEFALDSRLLTGAFLSVYYSNYFPNQINYTHVSSAFTTSNFEEFKGYVNANAITGEIITIETVQFVGESYESILKLNIPNTPEPPSGSVQLQTDFASNAVEHENIFAFDKKIEVSNLSGSGMSDFYYAIRYNNDELVEFKEFDKDVLNTEIQNLEDDKAFLLHIWGVRNGGVNSAYLNYNVIEGNLVMQNAQIYSENTKVLRPAWDFNSMIFAANQFTIIGDVTTPYQQIECRENFTFYAIFWQDAISGTRQQIQTTNSRLPATPNPFLGFATQDNEFSVVFTAVDGAIVKTLKYSGIGVKAGFNFVVGRWDAFNEGNRYIFINGLLQEGEFSNTNNFNINTDTVLNTYDEALLGANDLDSPSEFFSGKMFDFKISEESFTDKEELRKAFLRGELEFSSSLLKLSCNFNRVSPSEPVVSYQSGSYPVTSNNLTAYIDFNSLV